MKWLRGPVAYSAGRPVNDEIITPKSAGLAALSSVGKDYGFDSYRIPATFRVGSFRRGSGASRSIHSLLGVHFCVHRHRAGGNRHLGLALFVIAAAQLMLILDSTITNIALPSIQTALTVSDANLAWIVNSYALAFGGLLLLGGRA